MKVFRKKYLKNQYLLLLLAYFIMFGIITSAITSILNYYIRVKDIEKELITQADKKANYFESKIFEFIQESENDVRSIKRSNNFELYLKNKSGQNKESLSDIFIAIVNANRNINQLRYINEFGDEEIRVNQDSTKGAFIVSSNALQNKKNRYYFKEIKSLKPGVYWHSRIDLNVENDLIEKPYNPVIRIGSGIFQYGQFRGMVIINISMNNFLRDFITLNNFLSYIVDKDGLFLIHPKPDYSWGRYLGEKTSLKKEFPEQYENILSNKIYSGHFVYSYPLEAYIANREGLKLILKLKPKVLNSIKNSEIKTSIYLMVIIILLSFPVALLIALIPASLQAQKEKLLLKLSKYTDIIDRFVITSSLDGGGIIKDVSSAYCKVSGYEKKEVAGKLYNFNKGSEAAQIYNEVWKTISNGQIWRGELHNKKKDRTSYWVDSIITPEFAGRSNSIVGYSEVSFEITDKKEIQRLAETDGLTQISNRMKTETLLIYEIERSKRGSCNLGILIADIDHFKLINDTHGHIAGDTVLTEFARLAQLLIRKSDTVGRWGGEEFLVICPETSLEALKIVAEKIRSGVEQHKFPIINKMTLSLGVAVLDKNDDLDSLINRADQGLYEAKNNGRNQVGIASSK